MSRLEIRAFAEDYLSAAGSLLAARHREHRAAEPLLSERFEDPEATRGEVASLWAEEHASGAVALREGQVVGFLVGTRKDEQTWGANVWSSFPDWPQPPASCPEAFQPAVAPQPSLKTI